MIDESRNLIDEAVRIEKILDGKECNCSCFAYGSFECGCDAKWPEDYAKDGAEVIRRLIAELAKRPPINTELTALRDR